jgi:hypothetical protein
MMIAEEKSQNDSTAFASCRGSMKFKQTTNLRGFVACLV